MPCESERHRCVVPEQEVVDLFAFEEFVEQLSLRVLSLTVRDRLRQVRDNDRYCTTVIHLQARLDHRGVSYWLLDKKHAMVARASGQQMLRPLKDKIPSQM